MKIVITGASGFIGCQIVPLLRDGGADLLLAGRDPEALARRFPDLPVISYEDLAQRGAGYDALVHLAVRNNDQPGTLDDFRAANVTLLERIATAARTAGIGVFINITTLHAQTAGTDPYGRSKAEAEAFLNGFTGLRVVHLRLPAVYGTEYRGKLAVLNRVPAPLRPLAFKLLSALKPTVHVTRVAAAIRQEADAASASSSDPTPPGPTERIVSDAQRGNGVYAALRRLIDISFALFVILFLWWVLLAAWVAVRLSSPGPAIFAQERVGRQGVPFTCYKFRTMHMGTRQAGTHELTAASITRTGAFLRKTKIDELPQIWNLLRNQLSLVGPRPGLPVQTKLTEERMKRGVFEIPPGITGWAQIQNIDMSDPERLARTDAQYVALRSVLLDLKIILATARGKGQGDKVSL
ncbi:hypothetical protein BV394_16145 (plasmid) [Brevirhabdus pacifica]|uniref:Uncharacterized protein n=1 Tax=Brevirhabdus pacifica TaxID=1267768 RepID=A0A1P8QYE7_9RHOB|nr:hybrid nucleoside-diphosphate sugar epimerase/sugar transferase [Brevirhabdus pacifica]APX91419.1 hypothetical protein BV394_16145 [Brevirhabdus pacifica]PJJ78973.1 lipopolysaccharide/colanic/teichoic acid biosynthesis glycosyltransferase [Brevirhabdus pacifica]